MSCDQQHPGYDCGGTCAVAKFGTASPEPTEQDITRVCRTASQLYGDLIRLLNVQPESAIEQQALQLICDSYETVGLMAMEVKSRYEVDQPVKLLEGPHGSEQPYQGFHLKKCFNPACTTDHYSP